MKNSLRTMIYDAITTVGDTSSLKDALTSFDTAAKNTQEFADAIRNGTATLEQ